MTSTLLQGTGLAPPGSPGDMLISVLIISNELDRRTLHSWVNGEWVAEDGEMLLPGDHCTLWFLIRNPASDPDTSMQMLNQAIKHFDQGQARYHAQNLRDWLTGGGRMPAGKWERDDLLGLLGRVINARNWQDAVRSWNEFLRK